MVLYFFSGFLVAAIFLLHYQIKQILFISISDLDKFLIKLLCEKEIEGLQPNIIPSSSLVG